MFFRKSLFLLLLGHQIFISSGIEIEITKQCCNVGTNHSISGNECNNFPILSEVKKADQNFCMHSMQACCKRKEGDIQCDAGVALGLSEGTCSKAVGVKKSCCESCVLGKESVSSNPTCDDYLGFGSLFVKCCKASLTTSTSTTTTTMSTTSTTKATTTEKMNDLNLNKSLAPTSTVNLCEVEGICAQICIPMGDSYRCDCNKGFNLMEDKISCKLDKKVKKALNRCDTYNPCEHECLDTGVAIKCTCRDGYMLGSDNTSCKDIDECALGDHDCTKDEVCINDEGGYFCEDTSYTDNPFEYETKCPDGFKFNGEKSVCDDINECEINLLCPSSETCINTMGSYICEKKEIKCPPGFHYKSSVESCEDIDECINGEDNCNKETQICVNTKGNYTCVGKESKKKCPPGFRKNEFTQQCDDIDECSDDIPLCAVNEVCVNERGSYNCVPKPTPKITSMTTPKPTPFTTRRTTTTSTTQKAITCKNGFTLSKDRKSCVDINECQLGIHTCILNQRCDNTIGSYYCVRLAGCGTGYTYNSANQLCEDDDECALGTHNCNDLGSDYKCRNTLGSYRCDLIRRTRPPQIVTPRPSFRELTTEPIIISGMRKNCLIGYKMNNLGNCEDVNECLSNPCGRGETCLNLQGRYECITKKICKAGYDLNDAGDNCEDVNECARGTHKCNPTQICRNGDGYYTCECPPGHHLNPQTNHCEDIDECKYYKVCYYNAKCINTIGSYKCECKEGFKDVNGKCLDIDECFENPNYCEHKCVNVWGSFRCACQAGFTLNPDNRTCTDVDECTLFKDKRLCIGPCINIPGSYKCSCPAGYRLGADGRTCQDIDECERKICPYHNDICVNTRGSHKCYTINCPSHYIRDPQHRSQCKKPQNFCDSRDVECLQKPEQYTYHFISIVSDLPIINGGMNLFSIQGPRFPGTRTEFLLKIINSYCPSNIPKINDNYFRLIQDYEAMKLYITRSIKGPQEVELEIQMKLFDKNQLMLSTISRIFVIVTEYPY